MFSIWRLYCADDWQGVSGSLLRIAAELVTSKRFKLASVPIKYSDQPVHPQSLISIFDRCSMGSQGSNVSSDKTKTLIRLMGCAD